MIIDRVKVEPGQAYPDSLYVGSLGGPLPERVSLEGDIVTDVAIVGAGFTGLSAALALATAGLKCTVLEANAPGWGASGRNGGQLNPGLKFPPSVVRRDLGIDAVRLTQNSVDRVFDIVKEHGIECDIRRGGTLRAAVDQATLADLEALSRDAEGEGIRYQMVSREGIASRTGTGQYPGGLLDPKGGQLNPLKFALGLAQIAQRAGATIFSNTPVQGYEESAAGNKLVVPRGSVRAGAVLFATNGYTGPVPARLARSVMPVYSAIIASKPLPPALRSRIVAGGESVFETGAITTYFRVDAEGRLIFGGRGAMAEKSGPAAFAGLQAHAARLWPEIEQVGWEYGWNGRLALTADHYPHVHQFGSSALSFLGCNGRGVALATTMGEELARMLEAIVRGSNPYQSAIPITPVSTIAFQPLWPVGVSPALTLAKVRQWMRNRRA